MSDQTILPPSLASDERSSIIDKLTQRFSRLDRSKLILYLFDQTEQSAIIYLAEQLSLFGDGWGMAESEEAQRNMLKSAIQIHKRKGTPWAIREVFRSLGLGEIHIDEGRSGKRRDGTHKRDGWVIREEHIAHWAEYRIHCHQLLSIKTANAARELMANVGRFSCLLVEIDFSSAALVRNGYAIRDGSYSRGIIKGT